MNINSIAFTPTRLATPDIQIYRAAGDTYTTKDLFQMSRVYPKVGPGIQVAKPLAKRTKTVSVSATETADLILNLGGSMPVGTSSADIDAVLADMAAFCASNEAKALFKSLVITQ